MLKARRRSVAAGGGPRPRKSRLPLVEPLEGRSVVGSLLVGLPAMGPAPLAPGTRGPSSHRTAVARPERGVDLTPPHSQPQAQGRPAAWHGGPWVTDAGSSNGRAGTL